MLGAFVFMSAVFALFTVLSLNVVTAFIGVFALGMTIVLATGMQSNGTIAARNGHLIVCDMFGHRVVELDPANGRVLRVLLDGINGKPIDGPNDLVMDAKGGIYVSDPQFTPDEKKSQPGKHVY